MSTISQIEVGGSSYDIVGGIFYGEVDNTSTSTAYTATIEGISSLYDGLTIMLRNGIITSASGFTIDINDLGAKPVYNSMASGGTPARETTIFNASYIMLFIYSSTLVDGGCWICYRGYDSNSNTIGYQIRTNSSTLPASDKFYRYRLLFTSLDGTKWVPANTSSSTNATAQRTPNTKVIDPFGPIVYYGSTTAIDANASPSTGALWQQYTLVLGYSFNDTGATLVLSYPAPVFIKCTPQSGGGAKLDGYTQTLPTTADGKIYILLGIAYDETHVELKLEHPVYYYDGNGVRL